jgi:hypothetical protein
MTGAALAVLTTPLGALRRDSPRRGHALLAPADRALRVGYGRRARRPRALVGRAAARCAPARRRPLSGAATRFVVEGDEVRPVAQRAHWQPVEYNALHGGIERWFEPIEGAVLAMPAWRRILLAFADLASGLKGVQPWFVEAHQFRIDTTDGIGRPTPEGAHRDGVDFVAVVLVGREGIKGGETRVFAADGPTGLRFTMLEPWTTLVLDDARVVHESTPIQPLEADRPGHRDTLVITLRAGGFQGPGAT